VSQQLIPAKTTAIQLGFDQQSTWCLIDHAIRNRTFSMSLLRKPDAKLKVIILYQARYNISKLQGAIVVDATQQ
jgi:hypothetical protein